MHKKCMAAIFTVLFTSNVNASNTVLIDFENSSGVSDISLLYSGLGVTLHAIENPFPLLGPFSAPDTVPSIIGGVVSQGFGLQELGTVAVSGQPYFPLIYNLLEGNNGILLSFSFDVNHVSVHGIDLGYGLPPPLLDEDEAVTLTAYDINGVKLGYTYNTVNLPGPYDITPAVINFPNMRYVAFNYTGNGYGFYALDNLSFTAVPVPNAWALMLSGIGFLRLKIKRKTSASNS